MRRSVLIGLSAVLAITAPHTVTVRAGEFNRSFSDTPAASAHVRIIVQTRHPDAAREIVLSLGGRTGRQLPSVPGLVAELPSKHLQALAASPIVSAVAIDRPIRGTLARTVATIGANWVRENLGFDGSGIGVAIIDSGVVRAHDDLATRIAHFADFVDLQSEPHDGYGHGTHVAGIIAGGGQSSHGTRRGVAPGAHLVILKALDGQGDGYISNAIAALDYAIEQRTALNIRVINLSVAAGVHESYKTDPLTLAARRAVDAGIVVVTAAGNLGRDSEGRIQYGGITAPGNAPWVLTVGASSHNGTVHREDDVVAPFSSLGPSAIDLVAKPDLVAPGVGIEAAADPAGRLFAERPDARLWGSATVTQPYLSLSGTSMAAPVVAGTVALMLQANPALSPTSVKAILQGTAEAHDTESQLAQGAGFLNARAAVDLARTFAESPAPFELLASFVNDLEPAEGTWTAPCDIGDVECRYLNAAACAVAPGCFDDFAGAMAGVNVPAEQLTHPGAGTERQRKRGHR